MKKEHIVDLFILMMITFLIKGSYIFCNHQLYFYSDQIGTLALPAYLSGRDWSDVLANTPYYGFGYYWIFSFLFKLTTDYKIIYSTILVINFLLTEFIQILIYEICRRYCGDRVQSVFLAILSGAMYAYWVDITNEHPLFFGVWLVVGIILICSRVDKTKRILLSISLAVLLSYLVLVHERALALLMGVVAALLFLRIFTVNVVNLISFFPSLAISFVLGRWIKNKYLFLMYGQSSLMNSSVIDKEIANNFSISDVRGMVLCFATNIYKALMTSYGILIISFVIGCVILKLLLFKRKESKFIIDRNSGIIAVFLSCGFAFVITLLGLAYSQGGYLNYALTNHVDSQSFKSLFYLRYYEVYLGPLFMTTFALKRQLGVEIKAYNILIIIPLLLYKMFVANVLDIVWESKYGLKHMDFSPIYIDWHGNVEYGDYVFSTVFSLCILSIIMILIIKEKTRYSQIIAFIVMVMLLPHNFQLEKLSVQSDYDLIYDEIKNIDAREKPNELYVYGMNYNTAQFIFNDFKIIGIDELDNYKSGILLSGRDLGELENSRHRLLSEQQHIYIK